ncbi:MAG: GAF domain-containing protein, partial [Gemmatimonadota bacterium]|nr:GAF domain-containing protein [Gemmatimonadota bacterium]
MVREQESLEAAVGMTPPRRHGRVGGFDALAALDTVKTPVLVIAPDGRVDFLNVAAEELLHVSGADLVGTDLRGSLPWLADVVLPGTSTGITAEHPTTGGWTRSHIVAASAGTPSADAPALGAPLVVRVSSDAEGRLVVELESGAERTVRRTPTGVEAHIEENAALRALARQMADVADPRQLLRILASAASTQCRAAGAAVIQVAGDNGVIEGAVGALEHLQGDAFPLAGSLARRAIERRGPVVAADYGDDAFPLAHALRELRLGPVLLVPLVAHDRVLGVILVARPQAGARFADRETQRLQVVADHASLAIWKARLLEASQAADRAKMRFLATVSHEFRTPLTALTGYSELLADQVIGPLSEQQLDIIERMCSVTQHLSMMIEEVLAYTSLEAGYETVRASEFLAADLIRAVATGSEPLAHQKGLTLRVAVPPPIRVTSDIEKARQVLSHLVGNAIKFTDEGEVVLSVEQRPAEVCFTVA